MRVCECMFVHVSVICHAHWYVMCVSVSVIDITNGQEPEICGTAEICRTR